MKREGGHATALHPPPGIDVGESVDLSVLFVTRNEEAHLEECIRSTIASVEEAVRSGRLRTAEYVLVDSASTDRTVEIASRFPVKILRLEPSWPLSCGAGCYVGLKDVRGRFTAITNGDVVTDPTFFSHVLPYLTAQVGGVCGVATENLPGETVVERVVRRYSAVPSLTGPLPPEIKDHPGGYSTGTMILNTAAARAVGGYNPFLRAAEDMDLRHRLLRAGWKVLNVPVHQGLHFWAETGRPLDVLDYYRTILRNSAGLGQLTRYHLRRNPELSRLAAKPCLNARIIRDGLTGSLLAIWIAANALVLMSASLPLVAALVLFNVVMGYSAARGRPKDVTASERFFEKYLSPPVFVLVRLAGFVRGFVASPKDPSSYPSAAPDLTRGGMFGH